MSKIVWSKVHAHVYILDTSILSTHDNVPFEEKNTHKMLCPQQYMILLYPALGYLTIIL